MLLTVNDQYKYGTSSHICETAFSSANATKHLIRINLSKLIRVFPESCTDVFSIKLSQTVKAPSKKNTVAIVISFHFFNMFCRSLRRYIRFNKKTAKISRIDAVTSFRSLKTCSIIF